MKFYSNSFSSYTILNINTEYKKNYPRKGNYQNLLMTYIS